MFRTSRFRLLPFSGCLAVVICIVLATGSLHGQNRNSTARQRIQPSQFSDQCGSMVRWRASVDDAIKEAAESGKPVFWYVPTLQGTFMDRKPVIDRYMMSGPFSWPGMINLINKNFVPVKAVADAGLQARFDQIQRYKFVEPGFVVLASNGSVSHVIDQVTTVDPYWLAGLVAAWVDVEPPELWGKEIKPAADAFRQGQFEQFEKALKLVTAQELSAESLLLHGMCLWRLGKQEDARAVWRQAKNRFPEHPLAWKAAAEAENWGPFVRGFENHQLLPDAAYLAGTKSRGSAAPPATYTETELWQRSTRFLLNTQAADGSWKESDYDFGGFDSLPNVHMAVTALCGSALLDAALRMQEDKGTRIMDAVQRAARFCSDTNNLNTDDRDEILWANAFRVRFFAKLVSRDESFRDRYSAALQSAVRDLESIQTRQGTWYHEYANSFVTATALTALKVAQDAGAKVDQDKIKRGVLSLANDRFDNGAFPYYGQKETRRRGTAESSGRGQIRASAGRMPICELGLWQWGASDNQKLQVALNAAFEHHRLLAVAYKYDNHTDTLAYGGFFFWYDMRSRAEALRYLADKDLRNRLAAKHRQLVISLPELDGCFVDSHELGRCYGTAMALLTLGILDETATEKP